jgi:hypothetical protein
VLKASDNPGPDQLGAVAQSDLLIVLIAAGWEPDWHEVQTSIPPIELLRVLVAAHRSDGETARRRYRQSSDLDPDRVTQADLLLASASLPSER